MMLRPQTAASGMGQLGSVATGWSSPDMTQRTQDMLRRSGFPQAQCKESQHTGPFGDLYYTRDCRVVAGQALQYPADYLYSLMDTDGRIQAWMRAQLRSEAGPDVSGIDMTTYDTPAAPPLTIVTSGPTQEVVDPWALPKLTPPNPDGTVNAGGGAPATVTLPNGQTVTLVPQSAGGGSTVAVQSPQATVAQAAGNAAIAAGGTTTQASVAATQAVASTAAGIEPATAVTNAVASATGVSPQAAAAATATQAGLLDQLASEVGVSKAVLLGGAALVLVLMMRR